MDYAIGALLALAVSLAAAWLTLDRDRALYPVVMVVIASYYVLFAAMGATTGTVIIELAAAAAFAGLALAGFKASLWLVVAALAAHGVFDFIHPQLYDNPGVPPWWPTFCLGYDIAAAVYLAWAIKAGKIRASEPQHEGA